MKALVISEPGKAQIEDVPEPVVHDGEALLRVRRVGLCGSDLNSFRGRNPLVTFPRIPGHEVSATIVSLNERHSDFTVGMDVTLSPYTSCGRMRFVPEREKECLQKKRDDGRTTKRRLD